METFQAIGSDPFYVFSSVEDAKALGRYEDYEHMVVAGSSQRFASIQEMADTLELPELVKTFVSSDLAK